MSRAALLTRLNAPLTVKEIELRPLGFGQVLVRVLCSGICGAQLQEIDGHKPGGPLPHPMGHEGCGMVVDVGAGVTRVKAGDKVVMHWRKGEGIESDFPSYLLLDGPGDKRVISAGKVTTFAEYAVCSENRLTAVPLDTPDELCALLGCSLSTALGTIETEAGGVKFGERVLIVGCGGLGVNLILAARAAQASNITVLEINETKEDLAMSMGATFFMTADKESLYREFFDVIIETSGRPQAIELTLPMLGPSGRYIMVGQPRPGESVSIAGANHLFQGDGKTIMATQGGRFMPTRDIPRYVAMYRAGLLDISAIISHHAGLDGINEAISLVRAGEAGRIMVQM